MTRIIIEIDVSQFLPGAVAHEEARLQSFDGPRRRKNNDARLPFFSSQAMALEESTFWGNRRCHLISTRPRSIDERVQLRGPARRRKALGAPKESTLPSVEIPTAIHTFISPSLNLNELAAFTIEFQLPREGVMATKP